MSTVIEERQVYRCENPACSLGAVGEPGHFSGGISASGVNVLTGRPEESLEDHEHGEGVCPNCGKPGVPEGYTHEVRTSTEEDVGSLESRPTEDTTTSKKAK